MPAVLSNARPALSCLGGLAVPRGVPAPSTMPCITLSLWHGCHLGMSLCINSHCASLGFKHGGAMSPTPLAGQVTSQHPAPPWWLSHAWHHRQSSCHHVTPHSRPLLSCCSKMPSLGWQHPVLCIHPTCLKVHWASSKGTAGTQPWELPALVVRCWQPCATHPQAQGWDALCPSGLWLFLGRGGSHGHHSAPCCAPWL